MANRREFARRGQWQLAFLLLLLIVFGGSVSAKKKQAAAPQALVAGTVFHASGGSLRGVQVIVFDEARPKKKLRSVTDGRGEFAVRVPSGEAHYVVRASAKGFVSAEKKVRIYGMEKVNVNLILLSQKQGEKKQGEKKQGEK